MVAKFFGEGMPCAVGPQKSGHEGGGQGEKNVKSFVGEAKTEREEQEGPGRQKKVESWHQRAISLC